MQSTDAQPGGLTLSEEEALTVARILDSALRRRIAEPAELERVCGSGETILMAQKILAARRQRTRFLSPSLIGEPAWDMLLVLFVEPNGLPVTEAVERANVATTTALRWLEHLKDHDLVEKVRSEADRRIWVVSLSEKGRNLLNAYLNSLSPNFFLEESRISVTRLRD